LTLLPEESMNLAAWRDISIIVLTVQTLVMVVVVGILFYILNRGMSKLHGSVKRYSPIVQDRLRQVAEISERVSEKVAAPILNAETGSAKVRRWFVFLRSSIRS
jgi:hypothetical protein